MTRYTGLRVIDDMMPVVAVTASGGEQVRFAPALLTNDAADELARVLRTALPGAVVRVEFLPRVELRRV